VANTEEDRKTVQNIKEYLEEKKRAESLPPPKRKTDAKLPPVPPDTKRGNNSEF